MRAARAGLRPGRAAFSSIRHTADEVQMDGYIRSEQEEIFEQMCMSVDAHEQEAIEYFEK
ncbi:MAG: hypothetical protein CPDRYMAC_4639 [uncultured Paraburkholderia sp.]|nr:MAG: hypothetical protein CPDRYDRY_4501 [uncultured Paraburkholderia sp.]CAH2937593.1 MAG: hypothetical protein CPDRYMAC_4639 [uncultured Paraburkholderia sp.]